MVNLVSPLIVGVSVLIAVAFVTLYERKILGLIQFRLGPNKSGIVGLLQPFADAMKLMSKEEMLPYKGNVRLFLMAPLLMLTLMLALWASSPCESLGTPFSFSIIYFLTVMSIGVYPLMLMGWASNSKYGFLGGVRGVAQTISYEISMALAILIILSYIMSVKLTDFSKFASFQLLFSLVSGPLFILLISAVAETNRAPFDFAEGESELVSGFNVEFGGAKFALIFLSEYGMILLFSFLLSALSTYGLIESPLTATLGLSIAWAWVQLRGTFPRYRYDKLMSLAWKSLLPLTLGFLCLSATQAAV